MSVCFIRFIFLIITSLFLFFVRFFYYNGFSLFAPRPAINIVNQKLIIKIYLINNQNKD